MRILQPPPIIPPLPNGITISDSLNKENIKSYKKLLDNFEKRKIEIEKDTSRIVIAVSDTIYSLFRENSKTLNIKLYTTFAIPGIHNL